MILGILIYDSYEKRLLLAESRHFKGARASDGKDTD